MNNYAILSNNDAIKDDEGRRYFILDISGHRQIINGSKTEVENTQFWDDVYSCFNNEVGHAFYNYLIDVVEIKGFKPQSFPITNSKMDSFAKRLEPHENFIKHNYILQKININCSVQELYDEFVLFCKEEQRNPFKKIEFGSKLKELGIEYYKSNGSNKYKVSFDALQEIATTRHWIHDIDDYVKIEKVRTVKAEEDDELLSKYNELKLEYEKIKLKLEATKKEQPKKTTIRYIDSDSDSEEEEEEEQKPPPKKDKKNKIVQAIEKFTDSE